MSITDQNGKPIESTENIGEEKVEEKQPTKEELFAINPDRFVDMELVSLAYMKNPDNTQEGGTYLDPRLSIKELMGCLGLMEIRVLEESNLRKLHQVQQQQMVKSVQQVQNKNNFKNFIKGKR